MDTEELLVHNRRQRQRTEGFNTCLVNPLAILMLALEFEGEVVRKMPALVVAAQQPERVWIPNLQGPEVKDALATVSHALVKRGNRRTSMLKYPLST